MKKKKIVLSVLFCAVAAAAAVRIGFIWRSIPDTIYVWEGERYKFDRYEIFSGMFSMSSPADTSGALSSTGEIKSGADSNGYLADVRFLNSVSVKTVNVKTVEKSCVIPSGDTVGIKIYADGLEIIKKSGFKGENGKYVSPADNIPFKKGDVITGVNGRPTKTIQEFSAAISGTADSETELLIKRGDETYTVKAVPQKDSDGQCKIGLIVRDSMAGIGTMTYYCPADGTFGALGHGIEDSDTGDTFPLSRGTVEQAEVLSVERGKRGLPGEIHGMFCGKAELGEIYRNSSCGIYGNISARTSDALCAKEAIPVADMSDLHEGAAKLLCTIDKNGVREFDVEIEKIIPANENNSKGMIIHITDKELIAATGGIVQGMSGSPIIQDGLLAGAVTHVFVNDPTRGYGILAKAMLVESSISR